MPPPEDRGETKPSAASKGSAHWKAEQTLGTGNDQRLAEIASELPSEEMEVLRGSSWECDIHVHVRRFRAGIECVAVVRQLMLRVSTTSWQGWGADAMYLKHSLNAR